MKKQKILRHSTQTDGAKWKKMSESKISKVFRENQDCIPDWLSNFEYEVSKKGIDLIDQGCEFQLKFESLVQNLASRDQKQNFELQTPKMNDGTIQKYLTEF